MTWNIFDKNGVIWYNLGGTQKYVITNLKINNFNETNSQQENGIPIFLTQDNLDSAY